MISQSTQLAAMKVIATRHKFWHNLKIALEICSGISIVIFGPLAYFAGYPYNGGYYVIGVYAVTVLVFIPGIYFADAELRKFPTDER